MMRKLMLACVITISCSGDGLLGPAKDPLAACAGRPVTLALRLIVDHVNSHPTLQIGDTIAVSRLTLDPGRTNGNNCEGSTGSLRLRWPGATAESTYSATWINSGDYLEVIASGHGDQLNIAWGIRQPEQTWLINPTPIATAKGHFVIAD